MSLERLRRNAASTHTFASMDHHRADDHNAVLRELFELLEDYAPAWYTEEHHNRAAAALGEVLTTSAIN